MTRFFVRLCALFIGVTAPLMAHPGHEGDHPGHGWFHAGTVFDGALILLALCAIGYFILKARKNK